MRDLDRELWERVLADAGLADPDTDSDAHLIGVGTSIDLERQYPLLDSVGGLRYRSGAPTTCIACGDEIVSKRGPIGRTCSRQQCKDAVRGKSTVSTSSVGRSGEPTEGGYSNSAVSLFETCRPKNGRKPAYEPIELGLVNRPMTPPDMAWYGTKEPARASRAETYQLPADEPASHALIGRGVIPDGPVSVH